MRIWGMDYYFLRDRIAIPLLTSKNKFFLNFASLLIRVMAWPNSFDRNEYLENNPDVANAGLTPEVHALLMGLREGRLISAGSMDCMAGNRTNSNVKKTVIVVSHEASLTGAPIVALNLVDSLAVDFNVVTLLLGAGELEQEFRRNSILVYRDYVARRSDLGFEKKFLAVMRKHAPEFVFVNSLESRVALKAVKSAGIPSVALIHEFASYTKPTSAVRNAYELASEIVFSSELTRADSLKVLGKLPLEKVHVVAQGKSYLRSSKSKETDNSLLEKLQTNDNNVTRVLGAGFVQYRKGVDLFIECARQILESESPDKYEFYWFGDGFNPESDLGYSVYLQDQIERSGMNGKLKIVPAVGNFDEVLKRFDVFLLTSRLDPLPNVAIDALIKGLPVLAFDKASGFPQLFKNWGVDKDLVIPFLDVSAMAEKLVHFSRSPESLARLKVLLMDNAESEFSFENYVRKLCSIASFSQKKLSQNAR